jgi:hypothetical protein
MNTMRATTTIRATVLVAWTLAACGGSTPSSSAGHDAGARDSGHDAVAPDAPLEGATPEATTVDAAPVVVSLAINPQQRSIECLCPPVQLHAIATFSDASTEDVTSLATWTSQTTAVATVGAMTGLVTCEGAGTSVVGASFGGATATATVSGPGPEPASLALSPASASIAVGATQAFTVDAALPDGDTCALAPVSVVWTTSDLTVVTVSSSGLATAVAPGTATISATLGSVAGTATLTVQ